MRNTYKARFHPYKHKTNKINGYRTSDEIFEARLDKSYLKVFVPESFQPELGN